MSLPSNKLMLGTAASSIDYSEPFSPAQVIEIVAVVQEKEAQSLGHIFKLINEQLVNAFNRSETGRVTMTSISVDKLRTNTQANAIVRKYQEMGWRVNYKAHSDQRDGDYVIFTFEF